MLISFIGSPCSGKTTTASLVFSNLKNTGVAAEYVPEYARLYIAQKRVAANLKPSDKLKLTDDDQINIMRQQLHYEKTMKLACGKDVSIVADSSSLGALLYMSEECRASEEVKKMIQEAVSLQDLLFLVPPVQAMDYPLDPNRVHSAEESQAIHDSLQKVLAEHCPTVTAIHISGDAKLRSHLVIMKLGETL